MSNDHDFISTIKSRSEKFEDILYFPYNGHTCIYFIYITIHPVIEAYP